MTTTDRDYGRTAGIHGRRFVVWTRGSEILVAMLVTSLAEFDDRYSGDFHIGDVITLYDGDTAGQITIDKIVEVRTPSRQPPYELVEV